MFSDDPGPCPQKIQKLPKQNPETAAQTAPSIGIYIYI